jgi:hypothetical protein
VVKELHEKVRRRYIKGSKGKRKTYLEYRYSIYSWRYNTVTFEIDEGSQTKIVTLKEYIRRVPGNDKEWKRKHGSRAREVLVHTHPAPPAAPPPLAAPRPVTHPAPTPPIRASLPAPLIGPHNQLLVDLCGDLSRINDRGRRKERK